MNLAFVFAAAALVTASPNTPADAPIYDAAALNIGISCQWQMRCMTAQRHAMKHALKYVSKYRPPSSRIAQCNRNASRQPRGTRVDWVGFNNCVRNAAIVYIPPPPPRLLGRRRHHHWHRHRRHRRVGVFR
jgi:hypothetical protein